MRAECLGHCIIFIRCHERCVINFEAFTTSGKADMAVLCGDEDA